MNDSEVHSFRLPTKLADRMREIARRHGWRHSDVIRRALESFEAAETGLAEIQVSDNVTRFSVVGARLATNRTVGVSNAMNLPPIVTQGAMS